MESQPIGESRKYRKKKRQTIVVSVVAGALAGGFFLFHQGMPAQPGNHQTEREQTEDANPVEPISLSDWVDEHPSLGDAGDTPQTDGESTDENEVFPVLPPPPPASMEIMKRQGCVADGFLSGYGGDVRTSIALVNHSQCYYLHRALETWLRPPDFRLARKIQEKVTKPNTVYGMFIAEAINTHSHYYYPAEQREFDFDRMCRQGSRNYWGSHTCKPSLEKAEYRRYVQYIAEQAMDMGIQSFMFGEVFYQDAADRSRSMIPEVIQAMREYADFRGMQIFIGAQTNDITDSHYLKQFDFIEGGVGLAADGSVENGACFSRWWKQPGDWCWALLWNKQYASQANNVFLHFDWSGKVGDDMSVYTRMDKAERRETLNRLHTYFTSQHHGFLLPLMATLSRDNGGCSGPKKRFYSASDQYSCQDERSINDILGKQK